MLGAFTFELLHIDIIAYSFNIEKFGNNQSLMISVQIYNFALKTFLNPDIFLIYTKILFWSVLIRRQ